jgi:hypothetical protein
MTEAAAPVSAPTAVAPAPTSPAAVPSVQPVTGSSPSAASAPVTAAELTFAPIDGFPESRVGEVKALAKEMGWDQATASKYYEATAKAHASDVAAIKQEVAQAQAKFEAENKAHPVYGGAKYEESNQRIQQALAFAGEEGKALASFLESQDNAILVPQVRNFLAKVGYSLREGKVVNPGTQTPPKASLADRMFGAPSK